ncbi:hypothetical protein B7P43_G15827 [Cryptotermes secundus]|uniref:Pre-C2HC domain-containing protein n=1 Tax=Cryptotermes secundus TaxID=105785 RepID=A0A2J7Q414_9NEOP|nr:hypothetical protein B7P43_G15827 [Cryptotermes secundus]
MTKEPLNVFFVDLEPATDNKEIYKLARLQNQTIVIEPPRKAKGIPQCMRCQQYGYTRSYCNKPYICVKCGGSHSTQSCKKSKNMPAKCVVCGGTHPADYRGCEYYHKALKGKRNQEPNIIYPGEARENTNDPNTTNLIALWNAHGLLQEIWGCASKTNISIIQRCQRYYVRMITNAPWYVSNITLHEDLKVPLVKEVIKGKSTRYPYLNKIEGHKNVIFQPLLEPHNGRRLRRNWPADLREG